LAGPDNLGKGRSFRQIISFSKLPAFRDYQKLPVSGMANGKDVGW
jgi:hypothetical protein